MPLDLDAMTALAHASLTFNAPLSDQRADDIVARLRAPAGRTVVDLGCGWGELLLRLVAAHGCEGIGVDTAVVALERGRQLAAERGLAQRVTFVEADAASWTRPAEVVVCVGASHAWGGAEAMLPALRAVSAPGGLVLVGDGYWAGSPSATDLATFGELPTLPGLVDLAVAAGWRPIWVTTSSIDEWDSFESDWRSKLEVHADAEVRRFADERRTEYLHGYRGVVGFAWLILAVGSAP